MLLFGFSCGSINLILFRNSSGILCQLEDTRLDCIVSHTYEQNAPKLYVYLFLGWVHNGHKKRVRGEDSIMKMQQGPM